jgi:steroid 5-alpha reductase family enzyme
MIAGPAIAYALQAAAPGARAGWTLGLVVAWGLRLAAYVTWRNWGHGEDRRYQAIRARNEPHFALKSLVLVFALQAVLAWIASATALAAILGARPFGPLAVAGIAVAAFGLVFETLADAQMARFKADPANRGAVMDRGLWRFSRHPNYFGEATFWWGTWLLALDAGGLGAAWTIVSPLMLTVLLLKVSGVALLERDIGERRPAYRDYVARTNAFVPGPPRRGTP